MDTSTSPSPYPSQGNTPLTNERRRYRIQLFDARDTDGTARLETRWQQLVSDTAHLSSIFQSPEFFRFRMLRYPNADHRLAVISDQTGQVVGIVPMVVRTLPLELTIGGFDLGTLPFRCAHLLGGHLLMPQQEDLYTRLVAMLFQSLPRCDAVSLDYVRYETELWGFLTRLPSRLQQQWRVYFPEGARELNTIQLEGDFDAYLGKFSSKTRGSLKRKVRQLKDQSGGTLSLKRFDGEDSVEEYLSRAAKVSEQSWQFQRHGTQIFTTTDECEATRHLSRTGMFRSYVLVAGDTDVAFCTGWQHQGVYYYVKPAYDSRMARLSPGTVLLYLMIEDICRHHPANHVNLLQNDNAYKRFFGTHTGHDALVLICRRSIPNLARLTVHSSLQTAIRLSKDALRRPRSKEWWEAVPTQTLQSQ